MTELDPLSLDFAVRHPDLFARTLSHDDGEEYTRVLNCLPPDTRASVAARLPAAHVQKFLASAEHQPADWLANASFDNAISLLSRIPQAKRLSLIESLPEGERRHQLMQQQRYPAHSIGAIVSDIPMRIDADARATDMLAELRKLNTEDPIPLVVVDKNGHYIGILDRWRLLMSSPPTGVVRNYLIEVKAVRAETSIATAINNKAWLSRNWLAVVDHQQRILGGVSRERLFRAASTQAGGTDILFELLAKFCYMCSELFAGILTRKGTP